jgi:hypothetical protein
VRWKKAEDLITASIREVSRCGEFLRNGVYHATEGLERSSPYQRP